MVNRGGERFAWPGGAGTSRWPSSPRADLGATMQFSPYAAGKLLVHALNHCHRLPVLWGRVRRLEARESSARIREVGRRVSAT